jgi:hypothetical protein
LKSDPSIVTLGDFAPFIVIMKTIGVILSTLLFMIAVLAALMILSPLQEQEPQNHQHMQRQSGVDTEDGTCSDDSSSCEDNHEQCEKWMIKGEPRVIMDSSFQQIRAH